jgi:diguanylate cyclase (GGDEF)-like protein
MSGNVMGKIILFLKRWRYYGCTKDAIYSCIDEINDHNGRSLCIASLVSACLMLMLSFYPLAGPGHKKTVYYVFAAIQLLIFFYSWILRRRNMFTTTRCIAGITVYSAGLLFFSIYGCFVDQGIYVVRFLMFFLCFEFVFVFDALFNFLFNIMVMVMFFAALIFFHITPIVTLLEHQFFDIINILAGSLITMMLNWYITYVFLHGKITARSLQDERNRYHDESIHDQLTGLKNRRSFEQSIEFFTSVCQNVHQTVCVMMMDVDFFKQYNDFYGHQKGDEVLKAIGKALNRLTEENRVYAARVGGEEFIVLWAENRILEAQRVALKLRQMIIDLRLSHEKSSVASCVTASFGLYIMRGGSEDSASELYKAADEALYKAKADGRNCIVIHDSADKSFRRLDVEHPDELPDR